MPYVPEGTTGKSTMRSYVTSLPITTVIDSYKYVKLNDYLDGAMQIDDFAGTFYPPANYIQMGST
jgi:minor fimbrial subunit